MRTVQRAADADIGVHGECHAGEHRTWGDGDDRAVNGERAVGGGASGNIVRDDAAHDQSGRRGRRSGGGRSARHREGVAVAVGVAVAGVPVAVAVGVAVGVPVATWFVTASAVACCKLLSVATRQ